VQEGKLTVVGAVYDFRNDLGKGSGKITIVDVNGNGEATRMAAFAEAVEAEGSGLKKKDAKGMRKGDKPDGQAEISPELQKVIARAKEMSKPPPVAQAPAAKPGY
jgi:hypothetical protein